MGRKSTLAGYLLVHLQLWVHYFLLHSCASGVAFCIRSLVNATATVLQWTSVEVHFLLLCGLLSGICFIYI